MKQKLIHACKTLYESSVIRYVFFGGCTTLVNLISFAFLRSRNVELNTANLCSIVLAILFAYVVNSRFVFQASCRNFREQLSMFLKFIGARLFSMVVEVVGVWLFAEVLSMPDFAGKLITQVVVLVLNYICSKFFVFTKKR
jgi:putative flippase GtrA